MHIDSTGLAIMNLATAHHWITPLFDLYARDSIFKDVTVLNRSQAVFVNKDAACFSFANSAASHNRVALLFDRDARQLIGVDVAILNTAFASVIDEDAA